MSSGSELIYSKDYFEYQQNRSSLRKYLRRFYLHDIKKYCSGKTIDFGCGTGELLRILPAGSVGFEINEVAVDYCKNQGLAVELYDQDSDNYRFDMIEKNQYQTFTMNHVLEHLENSHIIINKIFSSCNKIGIKRIVFTVPGYKGFTSDSTHLTFIDFDYFAANNLLNNSFYQIYTYKYYPVNRKVFSKYFTHNELRLVFDHRL